MWALTVFFIILTICSVAGSLVFFFAPDLSAYLKAKTEELQAKTELLRKEKQHDINS